MAPERNDAIAEFMAAAGWGDAMLTPLPGDASTRRYLRATSRGRKAMLMDQPQGAESPACPSGASEAERQALGYNAVARLAGADCGRFVAVADYLRGRGVSAPQILAADTVNGFVLLEDLGDDLYADVIAAGGNEAALYRRAVETLAQLHTESAPAALADGMALYRYDATAMLAEVELLTDWFLPLALCRATAEEERLEHRAIWESVLAALPKVQPVIVLRDYHAQNLLWLPKRTGIAQVGVLDFQDALAGARSYDLVSLLEDARRDVAPELAEQMNLHYLDTMAAHGTKIEPEAQGAEMAIMAAQRNAKIVGIFARLFKRDSKPRYLGYLPRVWSYLNHDLEHPALASVKAWYDARIPAELRATPPMEGTEA